MTFDISKINELQNYINNTLNLQSKLEKKYDKLQIELESYLDRTAYENIEPYLIDLLQKIEALGGQDD